jgi:hypothetical protein
LKVTHRTLFLSVGLALSLVGAVGASERERDAATTPDNSLQTAPVEWQQISPGVVSATINGQEQTLSAAAVLKLDDALTQWGTIERAVYELNRAGLPVATDPSTGEKQSPAAVMGYFRDVIPPDVEKPLARTFEEFKATMPWLEKTIDGITVTAFPAAIAPNDEAFGYDKMTWMQRRETVPSWVDENGMRIYVDGIHMKIEPTVPPKDSQ